MLINRLMVSKTKMIPQIFRKNRSTLMPVLKQEALKSKKIIVVMVSLLKQKLIMPKNTKKVLVMMIMMHVHKQKAIHSCKGIFLDC